jgi:CDP-2,3-bis-(O-geranylgeranyl)-sn-glycerol synthase
MDIKNDAIVVIIGIFSWLLIMYLYAFLSTTYANTYFGIVFNALWFYFPAYASNCAPVFASKLTCFASFSTPIDLGYKLGKNPIFGKTKTIRGLIIGVSFGILTGVVAKFFKEDGLNMFVGGILGVGAMLGDLAGSFIKRRLSLPSGANLFFLDQIDFLLGPTPLLILFNKFKIEYLLVVLIITVPMNLITSKILFKLKLKDKPW